VKGSQKRRDDLKRDGKPEASASIGARRAPDCWKTVRGLKADNSMRRGPYGLVLAG